MKAAGEKDERGDETNEGRGDLGAERKLKFSPVFVAKEAAADRPDVTAAPRLLITAAQPEARNDQSDGEEFGGHGSGGKSEKLKR